MTTRTTLFLLFEIALFSRHIAAQEIPKDPQLFSHSVEQIFVFKQIFEVPSIAHFTETSTIGIQIENRYHLEELTKKQLYLFRKWKEHGLQWHIKHTGYSNFGTLDGRIGYSRMWNKKISVGMDFIYLLQHASGYTTRNCITFSISLFGKVNSKTGVGFQLFNPVQLGFWGEQFTSIPIQLDFFGYYVIHKNMMLSLSVTKYAPGEVDCSFTSIIQHQKLGIQYTLSMKTSGFGISYRFKRFHLHTSFQYHYQLGGSPGTYLIYQWN